MAVTKFSLYYFCPSSLQKVISRLQSLVHNVQIISSDLKVDVRLFNEKQMASIIFLDAPVGTGFSYGRTTRASSSTDIQFSNQVYEFMRKVCFRK